MNDARIDVRRYFQEFNARVSLEDHIAYREGQKPLSELSPLDAAYVEWGKSMARVKEALREAMAIEDICRLRSRDDSGPSRYFAYRKGMIWESPMNLKPDQWKRMIDEEAQSHGLMLEDVDSVQQDRANRSIPVAVRREVWRRDKGRCVTCQSQERLEFDHIIPLRSGRKQHGQKHPTVV